MPASRPSLIFPKREPRLNTREKGLHPFFWRTLQVLLERREGCFPRRSRSRPAGPHLRWHPCNGRTGREIGIMKRDRGRLNFVRRNRRSSFIMRSPSWNGTNGIDAEAAGIRAAQAPEHRDHLYHGRFPQVGSMNLHLSLTPASLKVAAARSRERAPVARAVIQHIINKRFVRESKDIIEIALGILRVASRMSPPRTVMAPRHGRVCSANRQAVRLRLKAPMKTRSTSLGSSSSDLRTRCSRYT